MPDLDRPIRIWYGSLNESNKIVYLEENAELTWARIEDGGFYEERGPTGGRQFFQLNLYTRWTSKRSSTIPTLMEIELVGEDYENLKSQNNPTGRWRIEQRSAPQDDRRRSLDFVLLRERYPITGI